MEKLKLDRKNPEVAIAQLEKAVNGFFPIGMRMTVAGNPPPIGKWKKISANGKLAEYEREK